MPFIRQQERPSFGINNSNNQHYNVHHSFPWILYAGKGMGKGGVGMGGGSSSSSSSTKKKKGGSKSKKNKNSATSAFSTSSSSTYSRASSTPFDVNASLLRLEKKYDEILTQAGKALQAYLDDDDDDDDFDSADATHEFSTHEYVVAVRTKGELVVSDWVPVAQMCLTRPTQQQQDLQQYDSIATDPLVRAAVSYYRRELGHAASLTARIFSTVGRDKLEYAIETVDSFQKHVYDAVLQANDESKSSKSSKSNQEEMLLTKMTRAQAREILQVDANCQDATEIKRMYRKLSFQWHPDRFVMARNGGGDDSEQTGGATTTPQEREHASNQYARIRLAYDTLCAAGFRSSSSTLTTTTEEGDNNNAAGARGSSTAMSWYESLGGRARTDFLGPVPLLSWTHAQEMMEQKHNQTQSGIVQLDPDLVQGFLTRVQAAGAVSAAAASASTAATVESTTSSSKTTAAV